MRGKGSLIAVVVGVASLILSGAALALKGGTTFKGTTSQSAAQTGHNNRIEFRVSRNGKRLAFVGTTNVVGNHCSDTLSDAQNAARGLGHRAPDPKIRRGGTFSGSISLTSGGATLQTTISGKVKRNGQRLSGTIREHEGPTASFPDGCDVNVSFSAKRR